MLSTNFDLAALFQSAVQSLRDVAKLTLGI